MKELISIAVLLLGTSSRAQDFPEKWTGDYEGLMILASIGKANDTIPVDFAMKEVEPDSVWTYTMTYHSKRFGELTKDYRIVRRSSGDTVNFWLDELNGIKMELTLLNNCFYGMYDVVGQRFISTIRLTGDNLVIELFAANDTDPLVTKAVEGDQEFEAKSYKTILHQTAYLRRKSDD